MVITTILVIGIKESANFNSAIVIIKLGIVGVFLVVGGYFLFSHPEVAKLNWHPFIPPADGHGNFGWGGIPTAAASIFFAYIGFDAVSTAAQEAKNPQKRDMPIGILGSLVVCTILYILVSLVLTGLVSYKTLNVSAPVALAIDATGVGWGSMLVKVGAVFGLATVMLVMLLGQSRVFYSMSKDGLLPKVGSAIHPKFRTPWIHDHRLRSVCCNHAGVSADRQAFGTGEHRHAAGLHDCVRGRMGAASAASADGTAVQDAAGAAGADSGHLVGAVPDVPAGADYLEVMIGWLLIGLVIYFSYSVKHSKVQKLPKARAAD
jgi:APA family basic amino acid/polyamine antiporter